MKSLFSRTLVVFGIFVLLVPCGVFAQDTPPTSVYVDVKPGGCENPLNIKSKGVLSVAILGTSEFDVSEIDPASISLVEIAPIRSCIKDVAAPPASVPTCPNPCTDTETGPDGLTDLTLKFNTQEIVKALGGWDGVSDGQCVILGLTGVLYDGTPIAGQDVVLILKKGKAPKPPRSH